MITDISMYTLFCICVLFSAFGYKVFINIIIIIEQPTVWIHQ